MFVTGTDTGIGKTVVSACLVRRWQAEYWKPVQTGLADDEGDSAVVARLAGAAPDRIHRPCVSLRAPLSPEAAARQEGEVISLGGFHLPAARTPIVVEGAGGVLVPLGGGGSMADLMRRFGLPVVLVARTTLGTINHTLLSIEALRARRLDIAGVVMVGPPNPDNADAVTRLAGVTIWATIVPMAALTPAAIAEAALALPPEPPTPIMWPDPQEAGAR